jgi:hypothetical protein
VLDTAAHKNGLRAYTDTTGRYPVSPSVVLNPPALYDREGAIEDGALLFEAPLPSANYTVEAAVTGAAAAIDAGYHIAVSGSAVAVTGHGVDTSAVSDTAIDKIKVTFFEEQVRVYVNDNPHHAIDVYGGAWASTDVAVSGALSNVRVLPETLGRQPGLALAAYVESDGLKADLRNTAAAAAPVVLIAAVYDEGGRLVHTEIADAQSAHTDETLSKRFALKPSEYPGCRFVVYAWEPGTHIPLVTRSQVG